MKEIRLDLTLSLTLTLRLWLTGFRRLLRALGLERKDGEV